jgi:Tfp pilus assembly protein PilV
MKVMISAFLCAIGLAAVAGMLLNSTFQETADVRFTTAGAELRHAEAGSNLVGTDWSGWNVPFAKH